MAKARRDLSPAQSLYYRDFFAWTRERAALLRRQAARESTTDLDLENLAEEIDSSGKSDRRALASQLAPITEHLLKLQFGRADEPRTGGRTRSTGLAQRLDGSWLTVQVSKAN